MKSFYSALPISVLLRNSADEVRRIDALSGCAMLTALSVVISRFTVFLTPTLRVGFSYLAIGAAGMLYGPILTGIMSMVVDLLRFLIIGGGPFFLGFTINAFLEGFLFGLFLYRRIPSLPRVFCAKLSVTLLINLLLNPLWLSILYKDAFVALVTVRLLKNVLLLPIETGLLYLVCKKINQLHIRKQK